MRLFAVVVCAALSACGAGGLQCGDSGPHNFVAYAWEATCGMKGGGWPKIPVANHSFACDTFPNVVPAVHSGLNISLVSCDIHPTGNATCAGCNSPDDLPEHASYAPNGGPSGGTSAQPAGQRAILTRTLRNAVLSAWDDHIGPDAQHTKCRGKDGGHSKIQCSPKFMRHGVCAFVGIWFTHTAARLKAENGAYFAAYKQAGGELDHILQDSEIGESEWATTIQPATASAACVHERWLAIQTDRRWPAALAALKARGFEPGDVSQPAYLATAMADNGSATLHGAYGNFSKNQVLFNQFVYEKIAGWYSEAFFEPARAHFPAIQASNYGFALFSAEFCRLPEQGRPSSPFGLGCAANPVRRVTGAVDGNVMAPSLYDDDNTLLSVMGQLVIVRMYVTATAAANASAVRPWVMSRSICLHAGCGKHQRDPHIPYNSTNQTAAMSSDGLWWAERMLHFTIAGADGVLWFNPVGPA